MNSESSKNSEQHVLIFKLTDKLDLRRGENIIVITSQHLLYMEKHKKLNNNKCKLSTPTQINQFELPNGSYSVLDNEDYFAHILKKHGENIDNLTIRTYANKIKNRITFKIKNGYNLTLLTSETMQLLWSTENKITKDENVESVPHLETTEVLLVYCNIVNNDYQQNSRALYTFIPNKLFFPLKTSNSEFQAIKVWVKDRNS